MIRKLTPADVWSRLDEPWGNGRTARAIEYLNPLEIMTLLWFTNRPNRPLVTVAEIADAFGRHHSTMSKNLNGLLKRNVLLVWRQHRGSAHSLEYALNPAWFE